ncbi:MAG: hypothetical protein IKJ99_04855 [Oscillospiraceae bacterium]|nr:hypothetical protein [Oscillospiraceae bacterium]
MATKSVLKNIDLRTRKSATALVTALEHAKRKSAKPVVNQGTFSDASRDEIRKMFEVRK